jgi:anhydro-N-acetylmuramic acid kinase
MPDLYIGLMSGTSMDGVDGVLADFSGPRLKVLAHCAAPFASELKAQLGALQASGPDELHRSAIAANALVQVYAQVVQELLNSTGSPAASVQAIGAHGQTVRHRPQEFDGTGYTLQINSPALLAERTGITVVADLRSRDVAAGGQGAPLVPAFHRGVFSRPGEQVCVLNLGGIANLSVLSLDDHVIGFDCGPANGLMDYWCQLQSGQPFDANGQWAASGAVIPGLLAELMTEPFLHKAPPKSTGRDLFNPQWLTGRLSNHQTAAPADVQATLAEFTTGACAVAVKRHAPNSRLLIVCGGGALNGHLMRRLAAALPGMAVESSAMHGLPPLQVEAAAFAWLARKALRREAGNLASVTGARGGRILGAIYPA